MGESKLGNIEEELLATEMGLKPAKLEIWLTREGISGRARFRLISVDVAKRAWRELKGAAAPDDLPRLAVVEEPKPNEAMPPQGLADASGGSTPPERVAGTTDAKQVATAKALAGKKTLSGAILAPTFPRVRVGIVHYLRVTDLNDAQEVEKPASPAPRNGPFLCIRASETASIWVELTTVAKVGC